MTPAAPLDKFSTWVSRLPGTAEKRSHPRLLERLETDALFATAPTWGTTQNEFSQARPVSKALHPFA